MNDILTLRKHLHQNPELSGAEFETAKTIVAFLKQYQPDEVLENLGNGNGVVAIFNPDNDIERTIMFRCELDALPIQEINTFEHRSLTEKVSHKCGHDGHIAILCNLAQKLADQKMKNTKVVLLFQPSEENGEGALSIFNDEQFKAIKIDQVFALHNLPGFDLHHIVVKNNTFTCAVNSIIIKLRGKTSHAAEPQNGQNPALAIAEIINEYNRKNQQDPAKENFTVLTPVFIEMGSKDYGISAGFGEVHYTFRRFANAEMKKLETELEEIATRIASKFKLEPEISWAERFSANENDPQTVDVVRSAAKELNFDLIERKTPFEFGEDFGLFTEHYKGAMFGLGSGIDQPNLHNPDYDWPDEITETGAQMFYKISQIIDAQ